ncbi:PREDICTED: Retrovirus-related Pol poly from transposon [Prunus dulcis]|uniref:PREDICTED: Retrovirus-related Pol poly from transposon n=1 Tax=Prunus dulcis TaxID=3755 RepID=A0A5E4FYA7_PRUDU|nr:PREDICTED: Retrovirus-related Pol poly from transposon [Prunus dulcis]
MFESKSLSNKLFLKEELHSLKMEEGASLMEHVSTFNRCIANLQRMDKVYKSEDKVVIFLTFLSLSYKHFRMTLMFGKGTLKYKDVMQDILMHDIIVQHSGDSSQGEGLVARTGERGHSSKHGGKSNNGGNSRSENNEGCFKCGSKDHWKRNCLG